MKFRDLQMDRMSGDLEINRMNGYLALLSSIFYNLMSLRLYQNDSQM
jgi:hypothetical protein